MIISSSLCQLHQHLWKSLMQIRKTVLDTPNEQKLGYSEFLAASFIFCKELVSSSLPPQVTEALYSIPIKEQMTEGDVRFIRDCASEAKKQDYEVYLDNFSAEKEGIKRCLFKVLQKWAEQPNFWTGIQELGNEATCTNSVIVPMIDGILSGFLFNRLDDKKLVLPKYCQNELRPDVAWSKGGIPFMIAEVKYLYLDNEALIKDRRKLFWMMKLLVDLHIFNRTERPQVIGLLVQNNSIEFFVMSLDHEALYIPRSMGIFTVPQSDEEFATLEQSFNALLAVRVGVYFFCFAFNLWHSCVLIVDSIYLDMNSHMKKLYG
ncbi:hypothetical protein BCR41DRAFT_386614, partial [Lobosporangium transversale]